MSYHTPHCRTDGFPLSHPHAESAHAAGAGGMSNAGSGRACTNPWHPKRISCPHCGRARKIVLASAVIQGEPVYLHCLRCRHLWQPARALP